MAFAFIFDEGPMKGTTMAYGFGSGDLEGVTVQASKGPWIYDYNLGYQYIGTQVGTITGFPTHLINK
jgi:hypothetical protein